MQIINPNEIGSKISTLIAESNEKFIVVSPYIDITQWKKIIVNLTRAIKRGVKIDFYFRELKEKDFQLLKKIGVNVYKIKGLHTKLYLNEKEVIVSSMNLYEFSDLYSIDIAIHFKESTEYNKIYDYFIKYINSKKETKRYNSKESEKNLQELFEYLTNRFSGSKITSAGTYLFSSQLNSIFHVMIKISEITFKYPQKNINDEKINELNLSFKKIFSDKIQLEEHNTTEETKYCYWRINTLNFSYLNFADTITEAQKLDN